MNVLMIESNYNSKYPPVGLMKIAYYHKEHRNDFVWLAKGKLPNRVSDKVKNQIEKSKYYATVTKSTVLLSGIIFCGHCGGRLTPERYQDHYEYMRDGESKFWIIDEQAAEVVKRIYELYLNGYGTYQIATELYKDKILTPNNYAINKGRKRSGKLIKDENPYTWRSSTIINILDTQEYTGDVINFKSTTVSCKNKKRINLPRDQWKVFKDIHDPVIERKTWEKVHAIRSASKKWRNAYIFRLAILCGLRFKTPLSPPQKCGITRILQLFTIRKLSFRRHLRNKPLYTSRLFTGGCAI